MISGIGRTVSEVRPHPQLYKIFWYAKYKRRTKRIDKKKEVSDALTKMLKTKQLKRRQCPDCGRALQYNYQYGICESSYSMRNRGYGYWGGMSGSKVKGDVER